MQPLTVRASPSIRDCRQQAQKLKSEAGVQHFLPRLRIPQAAAKNSRKMRQAVRSSPHWMDLPTNYELLPVHGALYTDIASERAQE